MSNALSQRILTEDRNQVLNDPDSDCREFICHHLAGQDFPVSFRQQDYCEYYLVISGSLVYASSQETGVLHAGELLFLRSKDKNIRIACHGKKCEAIRLSFSEEAFLSCCLYIGNHIIEALTDQARLPKLQLPKHTLPSVVQKHDFYHLISNHKEQTLRFKLLLADILTLFVMNAQSREYDHALLQLENLLEKMNSPEHIEEGIPAMLRIAGCSHGHLCRLMKNHLGMSPKQYLTELRLNHAAGLLTGSTMDVLSISFKVGYTSISHFISLFKLKYGITPLKYRQIHSK